LIFFAAVKTSRQNGWLLDQRKDWPDYYLASPNENWSFDASPSCGEAGFPPWVFFKRAIDVSGAQVRPVTVALQAFAMP
jgi:hypothetical protein